VVHIPVRSQFTGLFNGKDQIRQVFRGTVEMRKQPLLDTEALPEQGTDHVPAVTVRTVSRHDIPESVGQRADAGMDDSLVGIVNDFLFSDRSAVCLFNQSNMLGDNTAHLGISKAADKFAPRRSMVLPCFDASAFGYVVEKRTRDDQAAVEDNAAVGKQVRKRRGHTADLDRMGGNMLHHGRVHHDPVAGFPVWYGAGGAVHASLPIRGPFLCPHKKVNFSERNSTPLSFFPYKNMQKKFDFVINSVYGAYRVYTVFFAPGRGSRDKKLGFVVLM
jgi:hypothetical protein